MEMIYLGILNAGGVGDRKFGSVKARTSWSLLIRGCGRYVHDGKRDGVVKR